MVQELQMALDEIKGKLELSPKQGISRIA